MNNFPPNTASNRQFGGITIFAEDGDEEVKDFFDHARQLGPLVRGVEEGTGEVTKQSKTIKDGDDDDVGVEDDKCDLEHKYILVVTQLAKDIIPVVEELSPYGEAIADPESCTNLSDHGEHFIQHMLINPRPKARYKTYLSGENR